MITGLCWVPMFCVLRFALLCEFASVDAVRDMVPRCLIAFAAPLQGA